ncbi:glutamyl-tRNA(Gln) amidotransferase subunit B [Hepatocystis sp. ex Piliocolobus tephrosceles]|nr:glutamyl-tRNA(Gln) amidotransferase subunit B [Hepatocystis sp. ex Piliocolobus tephrosceles]
MLNCFFFFFFFFLSLIISNITEIKCYKIKINHKYTLPFFNNNTKKYNNKIITHINHIQSNENDVITEGLEKNVKSIIGLEVHIQLSTKHKAFCNCFNISSLYKEKSYEKYNNELISFLNENVFKKCKKKENNILNMLSEKIKMELVKKEKNTSVHTDINMDTYTNTYSDKVIKPNKYICNVCIGEVGSLNTLNATAVLFTYLIGIIFNCKLNNVINFDRKIYNYYDLPKGYQITQKYKPIGSNGYFIIDGKKFYINSVHLEEDTSKCFILHNTFSGNSGGNSGDGSESGDSGSSDSGSGDSGSGYSGGTDDTYNHSNDTNTNIITSTDTNAKETVPKCLNTKNIIQNKILLDYNRCGIPLVEIVVNKDYMTVDDCINLLKVIKNKVCILGVCVGNKENIRSDINISFEYKNIKSNRIEIKNVNSFTKIKNCIKIEKQNFINRIKKKNSINNDSNNGCNSGDNNGCNNGKYDKHVYTKSYLDNKNYMLRKKEEYTYVHESNIPEYKLKKNILNLLYFYVNHKIKIYDDKKKYKWSDQYFHVFSSDPFLYNYFNECLLYEQEKNVSNFIVNILLDVLKKKKLLSKNILIKPKHMCYLIKYLKKNKIDKTYLKTYLYKHIDIGFDKTEILNNVNTTSYEEIKQIVKKLINNNIKYVQIDNKHNNVILNEQNFKNRIIGLLKNQVKQLNSQLNINYHSVSDFIIYYVRKLVCAQAE